MRTRAIALTLATSLAAGCSLTAVQRRFSHCSEPGPTPDSRINVEPVQIEAFYSRLEAVTAGVPFREIGRVRTGHFELPMLRVGPLGVEGGRRVVVVAGTHGGEVAATLGGLAVVADIRRDPGSWAGAEVHVVLPANPAGFAVQSRYNENGCDIERDFESFRTFEAQALRIVINRLDPQLVIDLHESDRPGSALFATDRVPLEMAESIVHELDRASRKPGQPPAEIGRPGWHGGTSRLVEFAEKSGAGGLRIETPWRETDLRNRIRAQLVAVRSAVQALTCRSRDLR